MWQIHTIEYNQQFIQTMYKCVGMIRIIKS